MNTNGVGLMKARAIYLAARLGWPAAIGVIALCCAAAAFAYQAVVWPDAQERWLTQQEDLKQRIAAARSAPAAIARSPDQWADSLPDAGDALRFIEAVQSGAQQHSLQVEAAEYRSEKLLDGRVLRYRVAMPVRGSYASLREWLEDLLHRYPTAAVDELSVRRDTDGAAAIVGRVQLSHYSRGAT